MIFVLSTLLVLAVFNTLLVFSNLAVAGLQRRELAEAVDSLCAASNLQSGRIGTLEKVVVNAVDCLVTIDAAAIEDDEE